MPMEFDHDNPESSPEAKSAGRESDQKTRFCISFWRRLRQMDIIKWPSKRRSSITDGRGAAATAHHRHQLIKPATSIAASLNCRSVANFLTVVQPRMVQPGGFKYDPVSYSRNFDDSTWHEHDLNQDPRDPGVRS